MATVITGNLGHQAAQSEPQFPAWAQYFSPSQQKTLLEDDYIAGRNVALILISVVGAAMFAGLGAVLWIVLFAP